MSSEDIDKPRQSLTESETFSGSSKVDLWEVSSGKQCLTEGVTYMSNFSVHMIACERRRLKPTGVLNALNPLREDIRRST